MVTRDQDENDRWLAESDAQNTINWQVLQLAWCSLTNFHLWAHTPHAKRPRGRWLDAWCSLIDFTCKHTPCMPNICEAALWNRLASHNTSHCFEHSHLLSPMVLSFYTQYNIISNHTFYLHKQCFGRLVPLSSRGIVTWKEENGEAEKRKKRHVKQLYSKIKMSVFSLPWSFHGLSK